MRKFKVTTLSVSGKGKNIYSSGQIVNENGFHDADALVKSGHISEIFEETATENVVEAKTTETDVEKEIEATTDETETATENVVEAKTKKTSKK